MANEGSQSLINSSKFLASENFILRKVAGTYALISVGANIANFNGFVQLNETAAFLWKQLETPKSAEDLTAALLEEFDVSQDEAEKDVAEFLEQLIQENMVSIDG